MTVFRNENEPDPMPATASQLADSANLAKPEVPKTIFTGQDVALSQSLADLRKGYADAAKFRANRIGRLQSTVQTWTQPLTPMFLQWEFNSSTIGMSNIKGGIPA